MCVCDGSDMDWKCVREWTTPTKMEVYSIKNIYIYKNGKICYISILTERHHLNRVDHKSSQLEHDNENEIEWILHLWTDISQLPTLVYPGIRIFLHLNNT